MRLIDGDRLIEWLEGNEARGRVTNIEDIRFIVSELSYRHEDVDTNRLTAPVKRRSPANKDIRLLMLKNDLPMWKVADKIGIHWVTLSNWLRRDISEDRRAKVLMAVEALINERRAE